ncbi:ABC-type ATPase involved in cell division [Bradyrhizobium japonicum]|nr:ABC-type ATPase involved in cell division [Bradyrhizobium japonicum]
MNAHQSLAIGQKIETLEAISPAARNADAMVRFEGISKIYPAYRGKPGVNALQDIDFAIARGSITGVIGRSGAGKSSLVRLINGLEKPTTGRVIVDNSDISALAGRELRLAQRSIGMIFQHFNLLSSRTAADNIALPLEIAGWAKADIKARVAELLALVGIADKHDRYPSELSGGQKQRVGIARALATRPSVLLSDEATSALDPQTTRAILDLLANINRELGVTIVLITHEFRGATARQGSGGARRRPCRRERPCRRHLHAPQASDHAVLSSPKSSATACRCRLRAGSWRSRPPAGRP